MFESYATPPKFAKQNNFPGFDRAFVVLKTATQWEKGTLTFTGFLKEE
jgi:hypothetical protein